MAKSEQNVIERLLNNVGTEVEFTYVQQLFRQCFDVCVNKLLMK
jgi:chorismate mutase